MFFVALATDYDGTIATDGQTPADVIAALSRLKASGRRLILVTGRELPDLKIAFPEHEIFDRIVAENGALLYEPATQRQRALADAPSEAFVGALKKAGVSPLSVGKVIVATWEPNETLVLETIKACGLESQIIFNKGAVMVLPPGINKASGLAAALSELELSAINTVAVGDAENDHAFLKLCGCAVAVANALPEVKKEVDLVTEEPRGSGVIMLVDQIINQDAALFPHPRYELLIGDTPTGEQVLLPSQAGNILIAGQSAVGKSTIATALTERMVDLGLQFVIIDPEGDFETLDDAVQIGDGTHPPSLDQLSDLLREPSHNFVVNALAVSLEERPKLFGDVLAMVVDYRMRTGRPHWLIVDEAHHVLPTNLDSGPSLPAGLTGAIFITVHADSVAKAALDTIQLVVAAGETANEVITSFCDTLEENAPGPAIGCGPRQILLWDRRTHASPVCLVPRVPKQVHRRHTRKYAFGELGPDKSFYFRGAQGRLNLQAENLTTFLKLSEGVDDETWTFHRERGDYSSWIKDAIKDDDLAAVVARIEQDQELDAKDARDLLRNEIAQRYTAPARQPN